VIPACGTLSTAYDTSLTQCPGTHVEYLAGWGPCASFTQNNADEHPSPYNLPGFEGDALAMTGGFFLVCGTSSTKCEASLTQCPGTRVEHTAG
jgi:hypothetical protein